MGAHLFALAHNTDPREVVTEREAKSIGAEETYGADLRTREQCERELVALVDRACNRLRHAGLHARTITLKIRFADFETKTRARTLAEPTAVSTIVLDTARELLGVFDVTRGVRLLGVSCSQLDEPQGSVQAAFDLADDESATQDRVERRAAVERAVDTVRDRFGSRAVRPATLLDGERRE